MIEDKLNMTYYSGRDLYSDGDVEEAILEAVQEGGDIEKRLMEGDSWPFLYHLSSIRENILDWYSFNPRGSLLEIGSGCGALTGLFCRKVDHVTAVELSKRRSMINAARCRQHDNLTIMLGNFEDIVIEEKFDYVTLIGVFEYSICYISSGSPFMDMLEKIKGYLKPGGKLIIAIENKYGLKYFAGASEDHTGRCFNGLENYAGVGRVRTFSHKTLEKMLRGAGFAHNEFYYPMPDYKLPSEIYSDRRLPSFGSIRNPCVSYDRDRYELLDEKLVFDSICEDGMFGDFANSFLVVSSRERGIPDGQGSPAGSGAGGMHGAAFQTGRDTADGSPAGRQDAPADGGFVPETVVYAKYSRLRAPQFQIKTRIIYGRDGKKRVEKEALRSEAEAHVENLPENFRKLSGGGTPASGAKTGCFSPVPVIRTGKGLAVFPYIEGVSLAEKVSRCLGDRKKFLAAMHEAVDRIYGPGMLDAEGLEDFRPTEEFEKIFGRLDEMPDAGIMDRMKSLRVSNIDSILSNFVEQPDGSIACLDYEWVFDFPVPAEYLLYRTVYYYFSENRAYTDLPEQDFLAEFGITGQKAAVFRQMDDHFQQYVHGKDRKYIYTANYEKKTRNIGRNLQGQEGWFLSVIDDVCRINHEIGGFRRDLVECRVKMHRKSLFLDRHKNLDRRLRKIAGICRRMLGRRD